VNESGSDAVLYEVANRVAIITLNRPERMNAFDPEMLEMCREAVERADADGEVHVVVLTGSGKAFCSGGDTSRMGGEENVIEHKSYMSETIHQVHRALLRSPKVSIAMLNGSAVGAGLDIALACDLRFASDQGKFREVYVRLGHAAGGGGAYFLPRLIGLPRALELLLTARPIDADEAERIGLVNKCFPAEHLREETLELAAHIASLPPTAVRYMKRLVYESVGLEAMTALDLGAATAAILRAGDEHKQVMAEWRAARAGRNG
jgi:enoyl-CoA hydratase/carnithine racemase